MALLTDDISIFGESLPTVYIKNVTLEHSSAPSVSTDNRIIAHTAMKNEWTLQTLGAGQTSGAYTGHAGPKNKELVITVDFLLKENYANTFSQLGQTWTGNPSLQEYITLKTTLVKNSLVSKILQNRQHVEQYSQITKGSDLKEFWVAISLLANHGMLTQEEKELLSKFGVRTSGNNSLESRLGVSNNFILLHPQPGTNPQIPYERYLELEAESVGESTFTNLAVAMSKGDGINYGPDQALSQYAEVDEDGKKIVNYQLTKKYIQPECPFLCIHAYAFLDIEKLSEDFGLDLDFLALGGGGGIGGSARGNIKVQNILKNNKPSPQSTIFYLEEDKSIWTGHVHKTSTATGAPIYMTGHRTTPSSKKLIREVVDNVTVQDFRSVEKINKLKFDLSFMNNDTFSISDAYKYTRDKTDVLKQPAYFSKNYISRGIDGSAKLFFAVDFYSIVREQTMFGMTLPSSPFGPHQVPKSTEYYKLLRIKIKRRRVDVISQSNRLGTYNPQEIPFKSGYLGEPHINTEEIIQDIVAASQKTPLDGSALSSIGGGKYMQLNKQKSTFGSLISTEYVSTPAKKKFLDENGFVFFNASDNSIKDFTDGHYQYGVEMEILDTSRAVIIKKVKNLLIAYTKLMGYYNFVSVPGKTYNVNTGRFRPVVKNYYQQTQTTPWKEALETLMETIHEFRDQDEVFDAQGTTKFLLYVLDPNTGSPRGVETVLQLLLNAAQKLADIAKTTINMSVLSQLTSQLDADGNPTNVNKTDGDILSTNATKRIIKIEHFFDGSFNTEVPKRFGYDFLSTGENSKLTSHAGLRKIKGANFNSRLKLETQKYYNSIAPTNFEMTDLSSGIVFTQNDDIYRTLFGYLTPSVINLGVGQYAPKNLINSYQSPEIAQSSAVSKTSYSLLPNSNKLGLKYLFNQSVFSYIAAKITNYNNSSILPPYDTTILNKDTVLSKFEDKMKFYTQQILSSKNCLAVMEKALKYQVKSNKGLFMSTFLGEGIDQADSLDSNIDLAAAFLENPLSISYKGGAANSLFLSFVYGFSNQCSGIASTKSPAAMTLNNKERVFDLDFFKLAYDPAKPESVDTNIIQIIEMGLSEKESVVSAGSSMDTTYASPAVQNRLKALPNQIKSLLLQSQSGASVKHMWAKLNGNPSQNPYYKGSLAINYRNIKRVEYLAGYENGVNIGDGIPSTPMIGRPLWKTLNAGAYTNAIGTTLFCRLKTYTKKEFGIAPLECLEMPVIDEFFLLTPEDYDGVFTLPPAPAVMVDQDLLKSKEKDLSTGFKANSEYQDDSSMVPSVDKRIKDKAFNVLIEQAIETDPDGFTVNITKFNESKMQDI